METNHIPGPWKYDGEDYIRDNNGTAISQLSHSRRLSLSSAQANYKLMAAAPELLEALIELKRWVGQVTDWAGVGDPPTEIVDAAIKKATE